MQKTNPADIVKKFFKYLAIGLGVLVLVFLIFLFVVTGGLSGNKAMRQFKPIDKSLKNIGAKLICDNGDAGKGIDNSAPWYQAYYSVSSSQDLETKVKSFAASAGYTLENDDHAKMQMTGLQGYQNTTYLKSPNGQLAVSIFPTGDQADLLCGVKNYGQARVAAPGEELLDFSLNLPG
jgi:hypothetical protein